MILSDRNTVVRYHLSRPHNLGHDLCHEIREREFFGWVTYKDQKLGALELNEYQVDATLEKDEFLFWMDKFDSYEYQLAAALCGAWELADICGYGSILDFRSAWFLQSASRFDLFARASKVVIDELFADYAVLIIKASPLDYEGEITEDSDAAFQARRRAMIRYYRRLFRVRPLPGRLGRDGWLWRANPKVASYIPSPRPSRSQPAGNGWFRRYSR